MAQRLNCFTVAARAPLRDSLPLSEGIVFWQDEGGKHVLLGPLGSGYKVRMGISDERMEPEHDDQRLLFATYLSQRLVWAPGEPFELIIKVVTKDLIFGHEPLAEDLNLSAGGGGPTEPVEQYGGHKDTAVKEQLFCLHHGERVILIDARGAALQLGCVTGQPVIRPVNPALLAIGMSVRANEHKTTRAYAWASNNMKRLIGVVPGEDALIQNLRDKMDRHLATA